MDMPGQTQRHAGRHNRRDQTDPHQPQFWQAEHAGNQCVIEQEVGHRANQADHHHGGRPAHRTGKTTQRHKSHIAGQGERQQQQELARGFDVARRLAKQQEQRFDIPQHHCATQGQGPGQPQPGLRQPGRAFNIARALTNRHQRTHGSNHADAENRYERIARRTQTPASQSLWAQARHHQRIGEHHQHVSQLRGDQRPCQPHNGPEFDTCRMLFDHLFDFYRFVERLDSRRVECFKQRDKNDHWHD